MSVVRLAELAADQSGLFTAAQAAQVGVSAKAVYRHYTAGRIERVIHGVYRIAGASPSVHEELRAHWLATDPKRLAADRLADPDVVVSHRSAAAVHQLGDLEADVHEFTSPQRRQSRRTEIRFHRLAFSTGEVTIVDGLPVTSVERTIVDLARSRIDGGHLAGMVRDAIEAGHLDAAAAAGLLADYAHLYGVPLGDGQALLEDLLNQSGAAVSVSPQAERIADRLAAALVENPAVARAAAAAVADSPALRKVRSDLAAAGGPQAAQLRTLAQVLEASEPLRAQIARQIETLLDPNSTPSQRDTVLVRLLGESERFAATLRRLAARHDTHTGGGQDTAVANDSMTVTSAIRPNLGAEDPSDTPQVGHADVRRWYRQTCEITQTRVFVTLMPLLIR